LIAWPGGWEVRVLVDDETLLSEHCVRTDQAFTLADRWKRRMIDQGWKQVVPHADGQIDRQPSA
jgi:hypothetical protein